MQRIQWFERNFQFGVPAGMLPFYLDRLEGTLVRIEQRVSGIPDEILSYQPEGKWSVKQHIGHLAEVDEIATKRVDEMRNGISPMSPAVFEPKQNYNAQPVAEVLAYFRNNRTRQLEQYKNLTDHEITLSSLHPRLKVVMTPIDLAMFDAEHDDHHLVHIKEIIDRQLNK